MDDSDKSGKMNDGFLPEPDIYDLAGIGIGPSNLSIAALVHPLKEVTSCFCDQKKQFHWHPGLMFPDSTIQVSFLKDMVTLADPTSPFSFVSFLFATKRIYRFITANFSRVSRLEFNQYMRWICDSLPNLNFGCGIEAVDHDNECFQLYGNNGIIEARNLVLGTGLSPVIPQCARRHLGDTVFPAQEALGLDASGLRVAVVGGGQTGAEMVLHLLSNTARLPREIIWISRRANFMPLDESPFANELFTPSYSNHFFKLQPHEKARLLAEQKLSSDGISLDVLEAIYRRLYVLEFGQEKGRVCSLHPGCQFEELDRCDGEWVLTLHNSVRNRPEHLSADVIILCTGFEYRMPEFLQPLKERIHWTKDGYCLHEDFSIEWDGPRDQKIYVQNGARNQRGIADPNLSLMAWRSAIIINSLMKQKVYEVEQVSSLFELEVPAMKRQAAGGLV
jgi:lysine N6-hydroxylase